MNTNWTSPKTNYLAGINSLRSALASGYNARLIRAYNEDCSYPIKEYVIHTDFREYEFSYGTTNTFNNILNDSNMSDFEKHLALNYYNFYGSKDSVKKYYETGELSNKNFIGIGVSHLVRISDLINFFDLKENKTKKDIQWINIYREQYLNPETRDKSYIFNSYKLQKEYSKRKNKKFKHKLWVIELLSKDETICKAPFMVKVMNVLLYPIKYIPVKSTLRMSEYTIYTFRIGDVINGFTIEFQIPKKFNFK